MDSALRHLKVLYIEDDLVHRQEMADYLNRRVDKLYLAEDGEQGLEKFKLLKPDLVLTDLRMPKMTGLELTKAIREIDKSVPVIIMTALSDKETILEAVKFGILDYVVKPVDTKELIRVMESAVETISAMNEDFGLVIHTKEKLNLLKNDLTAYIKKETGKGPLDVRFKVTDNGLELVIHGSLTKYEIALLKEIRNKSMVAYSRRTFFLDRSLEIDQLVYKHLNDSRIKLEHVELDMDQDTCTLMFNS